VHGIAGRSFAIDLRSTLLGGGGVLPGDAAEYLTRLYVLLGLSALPLSTVFQYAPSALGLGFGAAAAPAVLVLLARGRRVTFDRPTAAAVAAFSLLALASVLWSHAPARTGAGAASFAGYALAGAALAAGAALLERDALGRARAALALGAALAVVSYVAQQGAMLVGPGPSVPDIWRMHKVSMYAVVAGVLLVQLVRTREAPRALLALVALGAVLVAVGDSDASKILAMCALVAFVAPRRALVAAFAALTLVIPFVAGPTFAFLEQRGLLAWKPNTIAARLEIWSAVSARVFDAPIFGHGANTVRLMEGVARSLRYTGFDDVISAHNTSVEVWYDLGAAGALLYLAMLVAAGLAALRQPARVLPLAVALHLCVLVPLSVDHRPWLSWLTGYIALVPVLFLLVRGAADAAQRTPSQR
jgi:O-antigen ligase